MRIKTQRNTRKNSNAKELAIATLPFPGDVSIFIDKYTSILRLSLFEFFDI